MARADQAIQRPRERRLLGPAPGFDEPTSISAGKFLLPIPPRHQSAADCRRVLGLGIKRIEVSIHSSSTCGGAFVLPRKWAIARDSTQEVKSVGWA